MPDRGGHAGAVSAVTHAPGYCLMPVKSAYNPPRGPGKGPGKGSERRMLDTSPEKQKERSAKGHAAKAAKAGYVAMLRQQAREKAIAEGRAEWLDAPPSRAEIADLARAGMPDAVEVIEHIIQTSRSDMARVQAFTALKETSYGKDGQAIAVTMDINSMSDDDLRAIVLKETGIVIDAEPESDPGARRIAVAAPEGQPA